MNTLPVPFDFLQNKDLSVFDALILSYIFAQKDDDFLFRETNNQISQVLNVKLSSIPSSLDKLYKLGYIDIFHENQQRIITYTYDAPHHLAKSGYIYIMLDEVNNFIKIGYSKNPKFRESTLQSEKPSIKLINRFKGTLSQEQHCHRILAKYRKRGEWFEGITVKQAEDVIKQVIGIA